MKNIVAILAGGVGNRAAAGIPKQFVDIDGKLLIERTLDVFERHPRIDEIIVVAHPDFVARMEELRAAGCYAKWGKTVAGGAERYLSSWAAVRACGGVEANILIHDAARPFVPADLIDRLLDALSAADGAVPVIQLSDTLLAVEENSVLRAEKRQNYRLAQTPQAFRLCAVVSAFQSAAEDSKCCVTDDCGLVLRYVPQAKIQTVEGSIHNLKLTYHSDIEYFNKIFKENAKNGL